MLTKLNIYDGTFFTSVKPYFKNVLNLIQLLLGSIFYTTHPFVKKLTTLETTGEVIRYFKYYGRNIFSRITVLYLIAKVEIIKLSHEIIKLKHEIIFCQKNRSKMFQVTEISKVVRKAIVASFISLSICRSLSSFVYRKCKYNTIFTTEPMK